MALIRQFVRTRDGATAPSPVLRGPGRTGDGATAPSLVLTGPRTSAERACGRGRLRGRVTFAEAKMTTEASMFRGFYNNNLQTVNNALFMNIERKNSK